MENVPGLSAATNCTTLNRALEILPRRYSVLDPIILDAADYGAATKRERLLVVGYDNEYVDAFSAEDLRAARSGNRTTVRDAISDLPKPSKHAFDGEWRPYPGGRRVSEYAQSLRRRPPKGLGSKVARSMHRSGLVSGCQPTEHSREITERFAAMSAGERDPISKYPRLDWNKPAFVLRAGTGADRGSYQAARPVHPSQARVISVREAARIQGFPDWYQFHPTKWHSHRMIGNSVSPIFAQAILSVIIESMAEPRKLHAAE